MCKPGSAVCLKLLQKTYCQAQIAGRTDEQAGCGLGPFGEIHISYRTASAGKSAGMALPIIYWSWTRIVIVLLAGSVQTGTFSLSMNPVMTCFARLRRLLPVCLPTMPGRGGRRAIIFRFRWQILVFLYLHIVLETMGKFSIRYEKNKPFGIIIDKDRPLPLNKALDEINARYGEFTLTQAALLHHSAIPNVIALAWKPWGHSQTIVPTVALNKISQAAE